MTNKKVIAAFDFDGTITTRDSLFHFANFALGTTAYFRSLFLFLPTALLYFLKIINNNTAKERLLKLFFAQKNTASIQAKAKDYVFELNTIIRPKAMEKLQWHLAQGHTCVLVSASCSLWLAPWAQSVGFAQVLSTNLEEKDGLFTGKMGKNCIGPEKVNRLLHAYPDRENYILYAYGDTSGDKELLATANFSFYREFN